MCRFESRRPSQASAAGRPTALVAALAAAILIATGCGGPAPATPSTAGTTPLPSSIAGEASPGTASPAPSTSPAPADGTGWTAVEPVAVVKVASLVPTKPGTDIVARDTAFVLTSLDGRPAAELASRVVAQPAIAFTVTASGADKAVLTPTHALAPSTRYQLALRRDDGTTEAAWTARTSGPLNVADTVPGDQATDVPLDTGIEVTFDQAGVTINDFAHHLTISPATTGHVEVSGRTLAFVPDKTLKKGTLYTVTVHKGLPLGTTGEVLGADVVMQFETATKHASQVRLWLRDDLVDANSGERAAFALAMDADEGVRLPTKTPVTVHRLAGIDAAIAAWRKADNAPDWAVWGTTPAIDTSGLTRVLSATVPIEHIADGDTEWIRLPRALPVGWYVVTVTYGGVPRQLVLQVTNTAVYAVATQTRTAVWVNDIRTKVAAVGATASLAGQPLGSTDARGLLQAATPASAKAQVSRIPLLRVRYAGAETFRPMAPGGLCAACDGKGDYRPYAADSHWWTLLQTDRSQYRNTDTMHAVGIVRNRATNAVPGSVTLVVYSSDNDTGVPIATQTATPDATGMYAATFALNALPSGNYALRATVNGDQVGEDWFTVGTIRKPAYALTVTVAKHAVISGTRLDTTVDAAFFEGTPVAGATFSIGASNQGDDTATMNDVTTDTSGRATGTVVPKITDSQMDTVEVGASATSPEEADIAGSTRVQVFAGSAYITIDGSPNAAGSAVAVHGAVNEVAFERYEAPGADPWTVDPKGAPIPGATVAIKVIAHTLRATRIGTAYDFITKRTEPLYRYTEGTAIVKAHTVRTTADGSFKLTFATVAHGYAYDVQATYRDSAGRRIQTTAWVSGEPWPDPYATASLIAADGHGDFGRYAVGDTIRVRFSAPATKMTAERYLFYTVQQGLRYATVGASPTFRTTFTADAVPNLDIMAVRFNGTGFDAVGSSYTASLDTSTRAIRVTLTPDKTRYQPGDTASVTVQTTGPDGHPVAASVFVRAVDEKLYAIGAVDAIDPLGELYAAVPDGVIGVAVSHRTPAWYRGGGGGDTTGGGGEGGRSDFRDWLVAQRIQTGADGRATVPVPLSDDLTSWRFAATALDARLDAGEASVLLQVGLPFFVDTVVAPEYLASDKVVIRVRSYGSALPEGATVTFKVSSDTLPMAEATVTAAAFGSAYVTLPALSVGTHRLRIAATTGTGATALSDAMIRTFSVVASRATQARTTWSLLSGTTKVQQGSGMTRLVVVDAGRGRVVPLLESVASTPAVRSDQELAAALANRVLVDQFGLEAVSPTDPNGLDVYQRDGELSIVSWGSVQLEVTALAAMTGDPRLSTADVRGYLLGAATDGEQTTSRRALAAAGAAALGEPVGPLLRTLAGKQLTVEAAANLALAYLMAGDEASAADLAQRLLRDHGLRKGDQVRIDAGPDADTTVVTARLAIVAASLGDPIAVNLDAYLDAHPSTVTSVDLERALAARGWAMRAAGAASSAAITVDGKRQELALGSGRGQAISLTPAQASGATLEPVTGSVLAVQTWDAPMDAASLANPGAVAFGRSAQPEGVVPAGKTVVVTLRIALPTDSDHTIWRVVDLVPSGLVPVEYFGYLNEEGTQDTVFPSVVDGQRVEFSVGWDPNSQQYTLRYLARVVTPGTYTWEPAIAQSTLDPTEGVVTKATTITIEAPGG